MGWMGEDATHVFRLRPLICLRSVWRGGLGRVRSSRGQEVTHVAHQKSSLVWLLRLGKGGLWKRSEEEGNSLLLTLLIKGIRLLSLPALALGPFQTLGQILFGERGGGCSGS
jgi:hypothetical protein